jgi:hypothetical protein
MTKTTWRKLISEALEDHNQAISDIQSIEPELGAWIDEEFHDGYGWQYKPSVLAFTAWTASLVLFPWAYDGELHVGTVPRYPTNVATLIDGQ